ncbi:MAG: hypothetical protein QGF59_11675, partial [Pirellulaceae bacterium]|nr:hypothetical protein [Pirellulaceae bacterium]
MVDPPIQEKTSFEWPSNAFFRCGSSLECSTCVSRWISIRQFPVTIPWSFKSMSGGTHSDNSSNILIRLSVMMFLQFFTWGAWFATLALALGSNGLGDYIGAAFESAPIAAIFA